VWRLLHDRLQQQPAAQAPASTDSDSGVVRIYFTRPDQPPDQPGDIAHAVVGYIDETERTLDVAAFELDNRIITDALVRAVRRGVRVRLVTESNYLDESGVKALRAVGVPVVDDKRDGALMHNKFMVFDGKAVWTGSMNFTENCAYRNNNNGVYIADPRLAENYSTKFSWMFEQRKFGGAPSRTDRIPNPLVTLSDGTPVENYFSTHDRPAGHVTEVVRQARKSIHFMAFSFTHEGIAQAMQERAAAGVEVTGVFEKTQTAAGHSAYFRMRDARLPVFLDGNPRNMHHKVIVIDGEIVVFGSFNFSESADKSNDENLLVIYNRAVAARFEEEFQKVLKQAREANP
jgi:phosphatidylserine/phosphatidylglycerophosphate/cardiolipin synthase-like enzyme